MEALRHALAEAKAARLQGELVCEQLASFGHSPDAKRSSSSSNRSSTAPWSATASGANLRQELSRTGKTIAASVQSTGIANKTLQEAKATRQRGDGLAARVQQQQQQQQQRSTVVRAMAAKHAEQIFEQAAHQQSPQLAATVEYRSRAASPMAVETPPGVQRSISPLDARGLEEQDLKDRDYVKAYAKNDTKVESGGFEPQTTDIAHGPVDMSRSDKVLRRANKYIRDVAQLPADAALTADILVEIIEAELGTGEEARAQLKRLCKTAVLEEKILLACNLLQRRNFMARNFGSMLDQDGNDERVRAPRPHNCLSAEADQLTQAWSPPRWPDGPRSPDNNPGSAFGASIPTGRLPDSRSSSAQRSRRGQSVLGRRSKSASRRRQAGDRVAEITAWTEKQEKWELDRREKLEEARLEAELADEEKCYRVTGKLVVDKRAVRSFVERTSIWEEERKKKAEEARQRMSAEADRTAARTTAHTPTNTQGSASAATRLHEWKAKRDAKLRKATLEQEARCRPVPIKSGRRTKSAHRQVDSSGNRDDSIKGGDPRTLMAWAARRDQKIAKLREAQYGGSSSTSKRGSSRKPKQNVDYKATARKKTAPVVNELAIPHEKCKNTGADAIISTSNVAAKAPPPPPPAVIAAVTAVAVAERAAGSAIATSPPPLPSSPESQSQHKHLQEGCQGSNSESSKDGKFIDAEREDQFPNVSNHEQTAEAAVAAPNASGDYTVNDSDAICNRNALVSEAESWLAKASLLISG